MFNHKPFSEGNFWFLKKQEDVQIPSKKPKTIETNLFQQVCIGFSNFYLNLFSKSISLF